MAATVAVVWLPGLADPLTYPKLLVLAAGGVAVLPAALRRWSVQKRPSLVLLVPPAAAVGLLAWGLVSMVGAGAPIWNSLYGWWGRGDGWLAWLGAVSLFLGAATLRGPEVSRLILWLLGGATLVALVGLLQTLGLNVPEGSAGQVSGTMGNTNFAAGYFAITGTLALGAAFGSKVPWLRAWAGVLFVVLAVLSILTDSTQGPAALGAGVLATAVVASILHRGRFRLVGLVGAGLALLASTAVITASFMGVGPLARLWSEGTFVIRQQYWQAATNIMNGLPVFGTGPDGFARYVSEFRTESYVQTVAPVLRVSAAHNIALQFGAVLGYVGIILWTLVFLGVAVALAIRVLRGPVTSTPMTAAAAGALVAYLTQGMVSIDMLPLLATGWLVAGLALAAAQEPLQGWTAPDPGAGSSSPPTRKRGSSVSRVPQRLQGPSIPVWVFVSGGIAGAAVAMLVMLQISTVNAVSSISTQDRALAIMSNPMVPCPLRVQLTQQVLRQLPVQVSVPATIEATNLDPRCPPMVNFASEVTLQQQQWREADRFTTLGVEIDPLLDVAWVLRSRYFLGVGDIEAAEEAAQEARRVQELSTSTNDATLVDQLEAEIESAR